MNNDNVFIWLKSEVLEGCKSNSPFPWSMVRVLEWQNDETVLVQRVCHKYPHEEDGAPIQVPTPFPVLYCNPSYGPNKKEEKIDQLSNLCHLHEAAILKTLSDRIRDDMPYTNAVNMCIAVNPLQDMPELYSVALRKKYIHEQYHPTSGLAPHIYQVSAKAFVDMRTSGEPQSILVSGESGAGKTESTKYMLHHVVEASVLQNVPQHDTLDTPPVIKRILESNPILEAFGNAGTVRNHNSSRFGKFTEVCFDNQGQVMGAKIQTYLLEKSRVVHQAKDEFRYNVFYHLISKHVQDRFGEQFVSEELQVHNLGLGAQTAKLAGNRHSSDGINLDAQHTLDSLEHIGMNTEQLKDIFRILAGVLHLQKVSFKSTSDEDMGNSVIENQKEAAFASKLVGLDLTELSRSVCFRTISAQGEQFVKPLTVDEAMDSMAGLLKAIYVSLFDWIVSNINQHLTSDRDLSTAVSTISLLDIFGFENFTSNCFEQFCINYANERLQQQFTQQVIRRVQQEYKDEGIPWETIEYTTNDALVSVIEGKVGILAMLNEECVRPKGSTKVFVSKVISIQSTTEAGNEPVVKKDRLNDAKFVVTHFAGVVTYNANLFLAKNKEAVAQSTIDLLLESQNPVLKRLMECQMRSKEATVNTQSTNRSSKAKLTVSSQFKSQLARLLERISGTQQHFVRCVKPNPEMEAGKFDFEMVSKQLTSSGVLEALQVARQGYPHKMTHEQAFQRYSCLFNHLSHESKTGIDALCEKLREILKGGHENLFVGKTKLFFTTTAFRVLEEHLANKSKAAAVQIQKQVRGYFARLKCAQLRAAMVVQSIWRMQSSKNAFLKLKSGAIKIQTWHRGKAMMRRYGKVLLALVKLQSSWRSFQAVLHVRQLKRSHAATSIQCWIRTTIEENKFLRMKWLTIRMQSFVRRKVQMKLYEKEIEKYRHDVSLQGQVSNLKLQLEMRDKRIQELEKKLSEANHGILSPSKAMREPLGEIQSNRKSLPLLSRKENNGKLSNLVSALDERDSFWESMGVPGSSSADKGCSECETFHTKLKAVQNENKKLRKAYSIARKQFLVVKRKLQEEGWTTFDETGTTKVPSSIHVSKPQAVLEPKGSRLKNHNASKIYEEQQGTKHTEKNINSSRPASTNADRTNMETPEQDESDFPIVMGGSADAIMRGFAEDTEQLGESLSSAFNTLSSAFFGIWGIAPEDDEHGGEDHTTDAKSSSYQTQPSYNRTTLEDSEKQKSTVAMRSAASSIR